MAMTNSDALSRQANLSVSPAVATAASNDGSRIAHSRAPNRSIAPACSQINSGGLVFQRSGAKP